MALGILLSLATGAAGTFSVALVPPPRLRPVPARIELHYVATGKLPFIARSLEWSVLGGYFSWETRRKYVTVPLRARDGLLVADGLKREPWGLAGWTLTGFSVRYGPYDIGVARDREPVGGPAGIPEVLEVHRGLDDLDGGGHRLPDATPRVRVVLDGDVPGPRADALPRGAGGLPEVALLPGREVQVPLTAAFESQGSTFASGAAIWRMETALVEERDLPAEPVLTRERWDALRAQPATRPALAVSWGFVGGGGEWVKPRLAVQAEGAVAPVVLLVASYVEVQREVRPAAIRLVPP